MKAYFIIAAIVAAILCASISYTYEVKLAWDANTEEDLAGYKIYWKRHARVANATLVDEPYENSVDVGNVTEYTVTDLTDMIWCFAATAYNTGLTESEFSNEVCVSGNSAVSYGGPGGAVVEIRKGDAGVMVIEQH